MLQTAAQQGNAQGITLLNAAGDVGAAACDAGGLDSFATQGLSITAPRFGARDHSGGRHRVRRRKRSLLVKHQQRHYSCFGSYIYSGDRLERDGSDGTARHWRR